MKNQIVTNQEMTLLNEIKSFTENEFSSSNFMWMYTDYMKGDMKINRGLMSSLIKKGIIEMDSYEDIDDAVKVNPYFFVVEENSIANFINISVK
jgi:hypothetical protein